VKFTAWLFGASIFFFLPVALVYGILTDFKELVGFPAIALVGLMCLMIGGYVGLHHRTTGDIASDNEQGEIADEAYEYGFYSPWSWWPLVVAIGGAITFMGVAVGWWIVPFGALILSVGVVGLVFEYDRGKHAH
jgi:xanthosine utilization system XapX-like protein